MAVIGGIVTLGATQAREKCFNQADRLGEGGQWLAAGALVAGLLLIVGAAICALLSARSVKDWELTDGELRELATRATAEKPKAQVLAA